MTQDTSKSDENPHFLCPSSKCEEDSILLGITQEDGKIAFLSQRMIVNREFVEIAKNIGQPEKRFRFSSACVNKSCTQWGNNRCGVIDKLIGMTEHIDEPEELPKCSIRSECRWYNQIGAKACAICPEVITDLREDTNEREQLISDD